MSHPLSAYLPRLVLRRLATGVPFAGPEATRTRAALLLSDIEGFSALVEHSVAGGRAALEELTWALNRYFVDVVDAVHAHGGDVLYIAGDAFYCCWTAKDDAALSRAAGQAAAAGAAIEQRTRGGRFATRIGVGTGDLVVAFAGGVGGRWELIATGSAFDDVVSAERGSATGAITLSHRAWPLVSGRATGRPLADGRWELIRAPAPAESSVAAVPSPADADRLLRPFVPPAVLDRMLAPEAEWLAEIRRVSVLLADLPPLGAAGAEELARTHACVHAFQDVMRRYEGTPKLDVDEKGILLLGAFGLPPLAHEDDAERAVHAALALREALDRIGVASGIGVATGRAFCGAFGGDARRDYMLRGDVINLAARLMHASAGAISCDAETVRAVRGRIEFGPAATILAKGRREPVATFRPAGAPLQPVRREVAAVGRTAERGWLAARVAALAAGDPGPPVVIEGDAGMGKSTILADLVLTAEAAGVRVLAAAADAIERTTAYFAWRPVFADLMQWHDTADAETRRRELETRFAGRPDLGRLLPLLAAVLPGDFPDTELTAEMTGEVRAANTRSLLAALLRDACAAGPTLLTVEDGHWLDSASWSLLTDVLRSVRALLVVVTTRPGGEPLTGAEVVRLEALADEDMLALVRQRLGVADIPPALASVIRDRVAGNPFFCDELLRSMRDAGAVRVEEGRCIVGDLRGLDLPTTIEGVILSRLDRLTPHQQLCLKVAAVIGRVFRARAVAETYPAEPERPRVPEHLASLARLDLTAPETPEPDLAYLFRHVITRDVTYDLMPLVQRRPLHRAVAEWIERRHGADLRAVAALLAYHWAQAANPARAVDYLEQAGQEALRGGAFHEALVFFGQAIELAEGGAVQATVARRASWEKGLGTAHYFLGDLARSRQHLERAVADLDRPVPAGSGPTVRALLSAAGAQALHRLSPGRILGRRGAERPVLEQAADCYKILGQIYYLDGEPPPRLAYLTVRGLNLGEEAGPSADLARILVNMSVLTGLLGFKSWGDWYGRRAIAMAQQEGQYAAGAYVWHIHALGEAQSARWASAKSANDEALRRIRELGDFNLEAEAYVVRATILLCEGDYADAPDAWTRSRQLSERTGNSQILCWSLLDEVDTLLGRDETGQADEVLDRALAVPTAATDGSSTLDKHRALAVTRLRQGRVQEALAAADVVLDTIARQPPTGYHWADYYASAAEVSVAALAAWSGGLDAQRRGLERRAARACRTLRKLGRNFWNVRPRALLVEGLRSAASGRRDAAARSFQAAEALAARMEMPFERARALLARAQLGPGQASAGDLADAAAIFDRLGAVYYARQLARIR
jgi:class 3 adenylate cyclase/tetratricopeptide (TPR) repeat protein